MRLSLAMYTAHFYIRRCAGIYRCDRVALTREYKYPQMFVYQCACSHASLRSEAETKAEKDCGSHWVLLDS